MGLVDVIPSKKTEVGLNSAAAASYGRGITNGFLIQKFFQRIMRDSASCQAA